MTDEYDVLVLGSGPAGAMTAIYAIRNGLKTLMFTGPSVGGQLTSTPEVENFPAFPNPVTGADLAARIFEQSKNIGVKVLYDSAMAVDFSSRPFICKTLDHMYYSRNLVIATGATPRSLGVEGEEKFRGFGVSSCAVCDGNFFRNQPVAVVGGGETAAVEALHMAHLASRVYLIYRKNKFSRMSETIVRRLESNDKIDIRFNSEVLEICGEERPKSVESIKIIDTKTKQIDEIGVQAVFAAVGIEPQSGLFLDSGLNIDDKGYIMTEKDSARTNIRNVYAVGDVVNKKYKQAVIAAGYGAIAALEIMEDCAL
ncbi:MAG: FAD-dependent oxidoreductase [Rickettsiales bacterium]|jgi:thioredoxin reductase (NADPH)|nr:FAD-dependent oxidoreductase [Rickettsiales bacterium]